MPHPDVAPWVRAARSSVGKTAAARLKAELQTVLIGVSLDEDLFICLRFMKYQTQEFWYPFLSKYFQSLIYKCFNFSFCNFYISMKNSAQYTQSINFSRLTLTE